MRPVGLLLALLLAFVAGVLAPVPARSQSQSGPAPDAIVAEIYEAYQGAAPLGLWPADPGPREMFSERLRPLLEKDFERAESDGIGRLDFDIFVDGQDFDISGVEVSGPRTDGGTAVVEAAFLNFGEPRRVVYTFVREADGWKIDEVASPNADYPWTLSELLSE